MASISLRVVVRRNTRTVVAAAVCAALAIAGCGGGGESDDRASVRAYIERVDAVVQETAAPIASANEAYAQFSAGKLQGREAIDRLTAASDGLQAQRDDLARVPAPPPARALRRRLLAVLDREIGLSDEARRLATYLPAAAAVTARLPQLGRRLQAGLTASSDPEGQARLLGRYAAALARLERGMRGLDPPQVLVDDHRVQLLRLQDAATLSGRLRDALRRGDGPSVARLLLRFRAATGMAAERTELQRTALKAYQRRIQGVYKAQAALRSEQQRVDRATG